MTAIRVTVENTSSAGGLYLSPMWIGFHNGFFDIYNIGEAASSGLGTLAEFGDPGPIGLELIGVDIDAQSGTVTAGLDPIAPGEVASGIFEIDSSSNGFVSLGAMILPSNDAFIGTETAVQLFDDEGFVGPFSMEFGGGDVLDAGTEVNNETDAAFIDDNSPSDGVDENGNVEVHPGFIGSVGNPAGEPFILGGKDNNLGEPIDPVAADFTGEGFKVATVHFGLVNEFIGTDGRDKFVGGIEDDIVDLLAGNDDARGGDGNDIIRGGSGDDVLRGGIGNNRVEGGSGADIFVKNGDGADVILDFKASQNDQLQFELDAINNFDELIAAGEQIGSSTIFTFDEMGSLELIITNIDSLVPEDVIFD